MSSAPPAKRPRTSAPPAAAPVLVPPITAAAISTLPPAAAHALLFELSTLHPANSPLISSYIKRHALAPAPVRPPPPPLDFSRYILPITSILAKSHSRKSRSAREELLEELVHDIYDTARLIVTEAGKSSHAKSRESAIGAVGDMASAILANKALRDDLIPHCVSESLVQGMEEVLDMMHARKEPMGLALEMLRQIDQEFEEDDDHEHFGDLRRKWLGGPGGEDDEEDEPEGRWDSEHLYCGQGCRYRR